MVHPATRRAVLTFVRGLAIPVDLGIVHPAGRAFWLGQPHSPGDVDIAVARLAAENSRGAHIFVRPFLAPGWTDLTEHPGIVLVDDLSADAVAAMRRDGIVPAALVETSPQNFQAWVRIAAYDVAPCGIARATARDLAVRYGADPRAVAAAQPGRMPGFTNRKEKHRKENGTFPFCRLVSVDPSAVLPSSKVAWKTDSIAAQAGGPRAASRQTPRPAADSSISLNSEFAEIWREAERTIAVEVAAGRRESSQSSRSEIDFRAVAIALRRGLHPERVSNALRHMRPDKSEGYAMRTITAVENLFMRYHQGINPRPRARRSPCDEP